MVIHLPVLFFKVIFVWSLLSSNVVVRICRLSTTVDMLLDCCIRERTVAVHQLRHECAEAWTVGECLSEDHWPSLSEPLCWVVFRWDVLLLSQFWHCLQRSCCCWRSWWRWMQVEWARGRHSWRPCHRHSQPSAQSLWTHRSVSHFTQSPAILCLLSVYLHDYLTCT